MDLKWKMVMLTMKARRFLKNTGRKLNLNGNDSVAFDKTKVECYNCHKRVHFARECRAPRGQETRSRDVTRKNVPVETPNSSALSKDKSNDVEPESVRKDSDAPIIKDWVSDDEEETVEKKEVKPSINWINFVKATTDNNPKKTVKNALTVNAARPINVVHPKRTMNAVNKESYFSKQAHSFAQRPNKKLTTLKNSYANKKVKNVWVKKVNTAKTKAAVNDAKAKAKHKVVKGKRGNAVKASACWGNPHEHLQDKAVIDSGCSRHMTRNMSFLTDYKEINEEYVTFGGNPKGGKIKGKGTKDETSGTLKSFITMVENLMNLRVKVIRCDNRTEFKNREMNQFCKVKGIMRQYIIVRIPRQNKVAERRNMTLIEAAKTMLADSKMPTTF
nr:putative ribonuclease H-like domain-containing protein [Tanacetum cinerariifolium]